MRAWRFGCLAFSVLHLGPFAAHFVYFGAGNLTDKLALLAISSHDLVSQNVFMN